MNNNSEVYKHIKINVINILKNKRKLQCKKIKVKEIKNDEDVYIVNFYGNNNISGTLMVLKNKGYRPFKFVSFEIFEIIDNEDTLTYYFYDDENSTIEEILAGIKGGIDYLIEHKG